MVETGKKVDAQRIKSQMDAWLGDIRPFPREWVIGKSGKKEFVEGRTVEILDPDDPSLKIIFFASPLGILIAEQNETGIVDLSNAVAAEAEDYLVHEKEVKRAIQQGQQILSYH